MEYKSEENTYRYMLKTEADVREFIQEISEAKYLPAHGKIVWHFGMVINED